MASLSNVNHTALGSSLASTTHVRKGFSSGSRFCLTAGPSPLTWRQSSLRGKFIPPHLPLNTSPCRGLKAFQTVCASAAPANVENSDSGTSENSPRVLIVGAGVAGLASALALHKVGIPSVVVERSAGRREGGSALSLWGNAWRALEVLGVGGILKNDYIPLKLVEILSSSGENLRTFSLDECGTGLNGKPHEVRGVRRSHLLKVLEEALPRGTVLYGTQIESWEEIPSGGVRVNLVSSNSEGREPKDAFTVQAMIGCDGANSQIAKSLGLTPPSYSGYLASRGLATLDMEDKRQRELSESLRGRIRMVWGRGVRAGMYSLSPSLIYWFTCYNEMDEGQAFAKLEELKSDKAQQKKMALETVPGWEGGIRDVIYATALEELTTQPIRERWDLLPLTGQRIGKGSVSLAGDSLHPMTPNLGQGACTALEDAVTLAQCLAGGTYSTLGTAGVASGGVPKALAEYEAKRAKRVTPLVVRSSLMGVALQTDNPLICVVRDKVVLPQLFTPSHFLDHALYDCGPLPVPALEFVKT